MAGTISSSHQLPLTSRSINLNPNSSIHSEINLESAASSRLNASCTFGANPSFVKGGKQLLHGSDLLFGDEDFPALNAAVGENGTQIPKRSYLASLNSYAATSITSSIKLAYEAPKSVSDEPCACFSSGELQTHIESCESFIVGYFVEKKLPYGFLKEKLTSLWNTKGDFTMTVYGEQAFLFNFSLKEDRTGVLELGYVQVANKLFLIRPWSPFIEQQICTISSVPIWMILRDVPLHLWNAMGFSRISSLVGKPIMTDAPTALKTRMSYARVCVEIDVSCEFPPELPFQIDDKKYVVRAEYPWKPSYCSHCKSFGHSIFKCSSNTAPKIKKVWIPKNISVDVVSSESEKITETPEVNVELNEEGPSMESHEASKTSMEILIGEGSGLIGLGSSDMEDAEGFERVYKRRKGSDKKREKIRQENICHLSPFSSLENLDVENPTVNLEASTSTGVGDGAVLEMVIEKEKDVFVPMTKEQNVEKLLNFASMVTSGECNDESKRSIFGELAENYQRNKKSKEKSMTEKELEKLGVTGEASNEKLGRGQRSSIKKKF